MFGSDLEPSRVGIGSYCEMSVVLQTDGVGYARYMTYWPLHGAYDGSFCRY